MSTIWVLVADTSCARIFSTEASHKPLREVETLIHPQARQAEQALGSDGPGSAMNRGGGQHHGLTLRRSLKQQEAESFALEVTRRLDTARKRNEFARLLVIAEPGFLGLLRSRFPAGLQSCVGFELDKNLSHTTSAREIRSYLPGRL